MSLHISPPSDSLAPFVRNYFLMENDFSETPPKDKLFPTGCHHLAFFPKGDIRLFIGRKPFDCTEPIMIGQSLKSFEYQYSARNSFGGIAFLPTGFYKLFGIDARDIREQCVPLRQYLHDEEYFQRLCQVMTPEAYIEAHEQMLSKKLERLHYLPPVVDQCIQDIHLHKGMVAIDELVGKYNCSRRYLEKHFAYSLGTSPGKYTKLIRFLLIIQEIETQCADTSKILAEFNHYDRSHLIKDFKLYMGEKPQQYYEKSHPLIELLVKSNNFDPVL